MMRTRALLLPLLLAAACTTVASRVRKADKEFSKGAAIELSAKFESRVASDGTPYPGSGPAQADAAVHYENARTQATSLVTESEAELKSKKLYGQTLMIKALANWRLGDVDEAAAEAARVAGIGDVGPRDRALSRAMPALLDIDAMAVRLASGAVDENAGAFVLFRQRAVRNRDKIRDVARDPALAGQPVQVFLAAAECELVYLLYNALGRQGDAVFEEGIPAYNAWRTEALGRLREVAPPLADRYARIAKALQ